VPIHEVNSILALDARVLFDALDLTIGTQLRRAGAALLGAP
jgi:hypothetical protein